MKRITDINVKIAESVTAIKKSRKKKNYVLQEPDYVSALTTVFPKLMTGVITGVRFGGCFIHQKPYVSFISSRDGSTHRCELGDLLVICRKTVDGKERFNASLLQFKKSANQDLEITMSNELLQLEVYTEWPILSTRNPVSTYDVQPKTVNMGAQYAEIHIPGGRYSSMYVHIPQVHMSFSSDMTLGRFISNMMEWEDGRTINEEVRKADEEWSKLIWDLISITKMSVFNRRNVRCEDEPRTSGDFFNLLCNDNLSNTDTTTNGTAEEGIPLLFIDIDGKRQGADIAE